MQIVEQRVIDTPQAAAGLIGRWLSRQLPPSAAAWFREALERCARGDMRDLGIAFGMVPRKLGKEDLALSDDDLAMAQRVRAGWAPLGWSVDQGARLALVLHGGRDPESIAWRVRTLAATADVGESIALYRGLPLYPEPGRYVSWAMEGVRTNMKAVFNAVAHDNPFPSEQFAEPAWNQMIVKAVFIGSPLHAIQGLDRRRNPGLARMLADFAHERWAAGRAVEAELWRCVGPYADGAILDDLRRVLVRGDTAERRAAALAMAEGSTPGAALLAELAPELQAEIAAGRLSWTTFRTMQA